MLYCWLMPVYNSIFINVKAIVAAFNQEMALVRAFSVIMKLQSSQRFVSSSSVQSVTHELMRGEEMVMVTMIGTMQGDISPAYDRCVHTAVSSSAHFMVSTFIASYLLSRCICYFLEHILGNDQSIVGGVPGTLNVTVTILMLSIPALFDSIPQPAPQKLSQRFCCHVNCSIIQLF